MGGYRVSGDGSRPGTFAVQAMDIAAVLDAIDEPHYVFGHSLGGLATLHAVPSVAEKLRAVALYEPPAALAGAPSEPVLASCREFVASGRNADAVGTLASRCWWASNNSIPGYGRSATDILPISGTTDFTD
jgi:pimeloyl-ACP methyl ester carboxylesterase